MQSLNCQVCCNCRCILPAQSRTTSCAGLIHVLANMMSDQKRSCRIRQQGHADPKVAGGAHREASICGQQLEAVLHVNELALDGSVVAAKVVERRIQLLQGQLSLNSQIVSTFHQLERWQALR